MRLRAPAFAKSGRFFLYKMCAMHYNSAMIRIADGWKEYSILATGDGYKLERWGGHILLRPDPQVIWPARRNLFAFPGLAAVYRRSERGGGAWEYKQPLPQSWNIGYKNLTFRVMPMGFKHTGLFPEQAVNWERMGALVQAARAQGRGVRVLNLFAYTGGASVACGRRQGHGRARRRKCPSFGHSKRDPLHCRRLQKVCPARVAAGQSLRRRRDGSALVRARAERRNVED